jgi:hypothetical protein
MSLELINTFGTLTTVVIVAATATAALVQLRHLRVGNQINAMLTIGEELGAKTFRDAGQLIGKKLKAAMDDPAFREFNIAMDRGQYPQDLDPAFVELRSATVLVGNSFEELGILVRRGIVDKEIFVDLFCNTVLRNWKRMELSTTLAREASGLPALWENFEYLAVLSEDWMNEHATGLYPSGVRRMQLTNPWPIAAPATT